MTVPLSPTRLNMIRAAIALNPTCEGQDAPAYRDRAELLAEVDRLNTQEPTRDELLAALTELVECKDLKDRLDRYEASSTDELAAMSEEYELRKPKAWDVARALVAKSKPPPPLCAVAFQGKPKNDGRCRRTEAGLETRPADTGNSENTAAGEPQGE